MFSREGFRLAGIVTVLLLFMVQVVGAASAPNVTVTGNPVVVESGTGHSDEAKPLGPKGDVGILATYAINGSLSTDTSDYYGPWYFSPGESVTVSISWTPTDSNVNVGLEDSAGTYYYLTCTGGSCSKTFQINEGDEFYVRIRNRGPNDINYSGYITI